MEYFKMHDINARAPLNAPIYDVSTPKARLFRHKRLFDIMMEQGDVDAATRHLNNMLRIYWDEIKPRKLDKTPAPPLAP
jgi:hypothetical protein